MKAIDVAVGVIVNGTEVLLAKRPKHLHQGDKWEFPGGKFESGETLHQAIKRELDEELGIVVEQQTPWFSLYFEYPEKCVNLHMSIVTAFSGEPHGKEGQPVEWVAIERLHTLTFPEANQPILEALQDGRWRQALD
ncbi:8-oxo-dGTP diphosphatase MutT [Alteromonas facilis]|uniref:8-oxo-dGTP diphosphatase MutT n=1 Tax=Alteromonas facilis TaxID=2048004 RepID=UPI000C294B25|nr:8-oxo-dGTP diphosphatase MutT [Alteromonas facilis]